MDFKPLYLTLFNALTDAIRCLDQQDPEEARRILIQAQQDAEEQYLSEEEPAP